MAEKWGEELRFMATVNPAIGDEVIDPKRDRLVITASSLGTVFEWYDFSRH